MSISDIIFYFFATITILAAGFVLFTKNVLHAALALFLVFLGASAIFVFAGADFVAIVHLMIYVGGILILIIFGIMLTNRVTGQNFIMTESKNIIPAVLAGASFFVLLVFLFLNFIPENPGWISRALNEGTYIKDSTIDTFGRNLLVNYLIPFEVIALLLLAALMGAALIAGKTMKSEEKNK